MFSFAAVHLSLDGRVLAFNLGVSLATGIVFGLAPALRATRGDLAADLKERAGPGPAGNWRPRRVLVTVQVALSVVALVGASLFLRSLQKADRIDPGFDAAHVGIVVFNVAEHGYSEERGRDFQRRALERASAVPGVVSASLALDWPFHVSFARTVLLEGPGEHRHRRGTARAGGGGLVRLFPHRWHSASARARFERVGWPDGAEGGDRQRSRGRQFLARPGPVGKRIRFSGEDAPVEVVGIARNANYVEIGERPQPMMYVSLMQYYYATSVVHIRTAGDPDPGGGRGAPRGAGARPEPAAAIAEHARHHPRSPLGAAALGGPAGGLRSLALHAGRHRNVWRDLVFGEPAQARIRGAHGIGGHCRRSGGPGAARRHPAGDLGVVAGVMLALAVRARSESMLFATAPRDALTF